MYICIHSLPDQFCTLSAFSVVPSQLDFSLFAPKLRCRVICCGGWTGHASSGNHRRRHLPPVPNTTIRYDTKRYFNVRSKTDTIHLNLPHGTNG